MDINRSLREQQSEEVAGMLERGESLFGVAKEKLGACWEAFREGSVQLGQHQQQALRDYMADGAGGWAETRADLGTAWDAFEPGFAGALADIRQKLVEEPWFGRPTTPQAVEIGIHGGPAPEADGDALGRTRPAEAMQPKQGGPEPEPPAPEHEQSIER